MNEKAKKKLLKWILKDYEEEKQAKRQREAEKKAKQEGEGEKAQAWLLGQYGQARKKSSEEELRELDKELKEKQIELWERFKERNDVHDKEIDDLIQQAKEELRKRLKRKEEAD